MFKLIWKIQSSSLMHKPRQLSFSFHSLVSREPALWFLHQPYIWWTQMKRRAIGYDPQASVVSADKELVIDGFQSSASSFAVAAFNQSQTRSVKLAHHLHSPAQIIKAIRLQIPILLTIREPEAAIVSLNSRWSHLSVTQGLKSYISFYSKLSPYASDCVISTFEQTTQHLDQVVQAVNAKFGTHFDLVDVAKANATHKPQFSPELAAKRKALKQENRQELAAAKNAKLLAQAKVLYREFEELAQQSVKL